MKHAFGLFAILAIVSIPNSSVAQEKPFITLDWSKPTGLGSLYVQATTDFNFWGWYSDAQLFKLLTFGIGLSNRLELRFSWVFGKNFPRSILRHNLPYLRQFSRSWIDNYVKINILNRERNIVGLATALSFTFPIKWEFFPQYPVILLRLIADQRFKRHYSALNIDLHLSQEPFWVFRFGYAYTIKHKNPVLNFGLESYLYYHAINPISYFMLGAGPTFSFQYNSKTFLSFFAMSLTPEFHKYFIQYFNVFRNEQIQELIAYPGGAIRITTGIKFM